ncbi:HlyD family secretion protein [Sphingobacterium detergens]|uniref:HlyD family secretion protein n=2 Tax=Sphingobacterium detergens TaxID=1145106 RepID=A0A420BKW4_SPHD1|nr:HlyD family secretion protein [Sphingobacterium detergens]
MNKNSNEAHIYSEDMHDIVAKPPSWLLRWGLTLIFLILSAIIAISAFLRYPDIIQANFKINTLNAPKALVPKISGSIVRLFVEDRQEVKEGDVIAWLESSANHQQILDLLEKLRLLRKSQNSDQFINFNAPDDLDLGELQNAYQTFYESYLSYKSAFVGGVYLKQRAFLLKEMDYQKKEQKKLFDQKTIYERDYQLAKKQHNSYQILADKKVISPMEMQEQESKLLSKQQPVEQIVQTILSNDANTVTKQKELSELDNKITTERKTFLQALNSLISEAELWKKQHTITASQSGRISFASIIQEKQYVEANRPLFYIDPGNSQYFCEMYVKQNNMGKVKMGQKVLLKMSSYPFEEYGAVEGEIEKITDIPYQDSIYLSKVKLSPNKNAKIILKTGMTGTANIVTDNSSLLQRFGRSVMHNMVR